MQGGKMVLPAYSVSGSANNPNRSAMIDITFAGSESGFRKVPAHMARPAAENIRFISRPV